MNRFLVVGLESELILYMYLLLSLWFFRYIFSFTSVDSSGDLCVVFLDGRQNSDDYSHRLRLRHVRECFDRVRARSGENTLQYTQDNASMHVSYLMRGLHEDNVFGDVCFHMHPPSSPDLNIVMELAWAVAQR